MRSRPENGLLDKTIFLHKGQKHSRENGQNPHTVHNPSHWGRNPELQISIHPQNLTSVFLDQKIDRDLQSLRKF